MKTAKFKKIGLFEISSDGANIEYTWLSSAVSAWREDEEEEEEEASADYNVSSSLHTDLTWNKLKCWISFVSYIFFNR